MIINGQEIPLLYKCCNIGRQCLRNEKLHNLDFSKGDNLMKHLSCLIKCQYSLHASKLILLVSVIRLVLSAAMNAPEF